ncbi:low molecular weight phosphatase family protein [Ornithinimicrobium pratense]|uniref:Low molecular weight phosphatase family protein n=1 Tax=Ornithinimicrobium pratense TaxID=2593973 RepID=A0A5J6V6W1_9MICO|nr:low molecular weight phosphatase family protein [Ornithinimicrobium pratense]QFG69760.1 low molecular weight phosphatase family protein [Ornithinimicrobium pratense]
MASILTVCTGNVCRSPLIERLLQRRLDEAYGPGVVQVHSAGTGALVDAAMDEQSARILTDLGGDHAGFLSRWLEPQMVADADLILTATREHRHTAMQHAPRALRRSFTVRELAHLVQGLDPVELPTDPQGRIEAVTRCAAANRGNVAGLDPAELDIVDPYRQPAEAYEEMRRQLVPAIDAITRVLTP